MQRLFGRYKRKGVKDMCENNDKNTLMTDKILNMLTEDYIIATRVGIERLIENNLKNAPIPLFMPWHIKLLRGKNPRFR